MNQRKSDEAPDSGIPEHGEGNHAAGRAYDDATREFVRSGRVDDAARAAEPADEAERAELERAERDGASRAKEEDPALRGDTPSRRSST